MVAYSAAREKQRVEVLEESGRIRRLAEGFVEQGRLAEGRLDSALEVGWEAEVVPVEEWARQLAEAEARETEVEVEA